MLVVTDKSGGISKDGQIPWKDNPKYTIALNGIFMNTFSEEPNQGYNAIIMGRKTWESIDEKMKPMPGRVNIILSRNAETFKTNNPNIAEMPLVYIKSSLDDALEFVAKKKNIDKVWLIGGGQLFTDALNHSQLDRIHVGVLPEDFECDKKLDFSNENYVLLHDWTTDSGLHSSPIFRYTYYKAKKEDVVGYVNSITIPSS